MSSVKILLKIKKEKKKSRQWHTPKIPALRSTQEVEARKSLCRPSYIA
jgi:hypothetical protein